MARARRAYRQIPPQANPFRQPDPEPKVSFDLNQKVLVFLENKPLKYIPCLPVSEDDMVSRIPHMSWIKYRGLAKVNGELYMRFIHDEAQVYVGLGFLPYLEDIPQRNPWDKKILPKGKSIRVKQVKPRGLRARRKPGIRQKPLKKPC